MKNYKYLFTFLFMIIGFYTANAQYMEYKPLSSPSTLNTQVLEDGWYNATVNYSNTGNGYKATYQLKVRVINDTVIFIDLGNGNLHSGMNDSGYTWSGGYLKFVKDLDGNLKAAYTNVNIVDKDIAPKIFSIYIQ